MNGIKAKYRQSTSTGTPVVDDKEVDCDESYYRGVKQITGELEAVAREGRHQRHFSSHVAGVAFQVERIALGYNAVNYGVNKYDSSSDDDRLMSTQCFITEMARWRARSKIRYHDQALAQAARVAFHGGAAMLQASTSVMAVRIPTTTAAMENRACNIWAIESMRIFVYLT